MVRREVCELAKANGLVMAAASTHPFSSWKAQEITQKERYYEHVEQMAEVNELGGFIQSLSIWPEKPEIAGLVRLPAWPDSAT